MSRFTLALLLGALTPCSALLAITSTATSSPLGSFGINIAAGSGNSGTISVLSFPLQAANAATGQMTGVITGLTASSLSNSNANWTAGQLSQVTQPSLIQITSGTAAGRTFLISTGTANTGTTVTLDSTDAGLTNLTSLGIVAGTDTYRILEADTISSLFGTPAQTGVLGGTTSTNADQLQLYSPLSGWNYYYYNTTSGWVRVGPPIASGNTVIRPDTGVVYLRRGTTPINLLLLGRVPSTQRETLVGNSGVTLLANSWPVDLTLAGSNISQLTGWVSASSYSTADLVQVYSSASGWLQYYYNGTHWLQVGPPIVSDNVVLPAGTAVIIVKRGTTAGQATLSQPLPYSI